MIKDIPKNKLQRFGFLIGFGFPIFIGWILPAIGGHIFRNWTLWIGVPSLLIGIIKPNWLKYPYIGWMKLGNILGFFNSKLILGLVFILVLIPISLIMKSFKYDPLKSRKVYLKTYKENKKNYKINLNRIF